MSNYTKSTNFATKDNLTPGDPLKIVRGTEIDTEFNNIATAIATKTDNASAAITGGTINDTTIGATTASTGAFTTISATGAITSTLATGTAPLVVASTTKVTNLNVDSLDGADWASPAALGSTTPAAVSATTLSASGNVTLSGGTANGVAYLNGSKVVTSGSALVFDGTSLGVGTSSPAYKLDVRGVLGSGNGTITSGFSYDTGGLVGTFSNHALGVLTNGNVVAKFDTSGNLGLGVTPNAWNSVFKAVSVGRAGSNLFGQTSSNLTGVTANAIFDSSDWKYVTSDNASRYQQNSGVHSWFTAPSGTAGDAITFTQAMTLDSGGSVQIGTTTAYGGRLTVQDRVNGTVYSVLRNSYFDTGACSGGYSINLGNGFAYMKASIPSANSGSTSLELHVSSGGSDVTAATIDSSGNLIQTVNTTAATLTTNQTLTFSIVDNSTLRISVRGSDGTTRTATVALT